MIDSGHIDALRDTCRNLLETGTVDVVIGYGFSVGEDPHPTFITDPAATDRLVFDHRCTQNLTRYLTQPDVRRFGRPAVVVKGCDARTVVVLEKEAQLVREDVHVIGVACDGVGAPLSAKCLVCDVHMPLGCDEVIGEAAGVPEPIGRDDRYAELDALMELSGDDRFEYWAGEMERCLRCYACRQVCPLCYCPVCVMDKNRPQVVDTSPHAKGNLAFHITRAFHLAGRCVGCDECTRACPAGINVRILNLAIARAVEQEFDFRPGMDPAAGPVTGSYSIGDREDFIR